MIDGMTKVLEEMESDTCTQDQTIPK